MRALVVSDVEDKALWDYYTPGRVEDVDLILSAGDLDADYLEFLVTMTNKPLFYVHGNHDTAYRQNPPGGCIDVDGGLYVYRGLRILGLGGSMRYKDAPFEYTEKEMRRRIRRLTPRIRRAGGFDVLLTHSPAAGVGDLPDHVHRGFECLGELVERWKPALMVYGHVHLSYGAGMEREREFACGTRAVNAFCKSYLDVEPVGTLPHPWMEPMINARCLRDGEKSAAHGFLPGTSGTAFGSYSQW